MIVVPITSEVHSQGVESKHYGMSNIALLEDALSSRMYKDAYYATVREILANARDANRESGKSDVPVRIFFPDAATAALRIQDDGIGINRTRMEKNFAMYCESTKANDNKQHGGYGLGCKTPFSFSKSFTVTTVAVDDDGVKRRRVWSHFKDAAGRSSYAILDEAETDDPTGTEVSIPVSRGQTEKLVNSYTAITKWWKTDPIPETPDAPHLRATPAAYKQYHPWFALTTGSDDKPMAIVDGVPYELPWVGTVPLIMFFGIGELPLTVTRDDLDARAEPIVRDRMEAIVNLIKKGKISVNGVADAIVLNRTFAAVLRGAPITFNGIPHRWAVPPGVVVRDIDQSGITKVDQNNSDENSISLGMSYVRRRMLLLTTRRKSFAKTVKEWLKNIKNREGISSIMVVRLTPFTPPDFAQWVGAVAHGELESVVPFPITEKKSTIYGPAPLWEIECGKRVPYRKPNLDFQAGYVLAGKDKTEVVCSITGKVLNVGDVDRLTSGRVMVVRQVSDADPKWTPLRTLMVEKALRLQKDFAVIVERPDWASRLDSVLSRRERTSLPVYAEFAKASMVVSTHHTARSQCEHETRYARALWGENAVPPYNPTVVEGPFAALIPSRAISLLDIDADEHYRKLLMQSLSPEPEYSI